MQHVRQHRLNGVARAVEIHGEIAVPQLVRHILKLCLSGDAGVVHQQRHAAEGLLHAAHHRVHRRALGDVRLHRHGFAAVFAQQRHKLLRFVAAFKIVHAHGIAVLREPVRDRASDAAGRTGDQCNLFQAFSPLPVSSAAFCRFISRRTGTLTHSDAARKNAMPTTRFRLIASWNTAAASAVARIGFKR